MEVKEYLQNAEDSMQLAMEYLDDTLSHIRAGKASARLLDGIRVDYYGTQSPVSNVANVSVPDARTIAITPWEKSMFKEIEKAIINSDLGITPENNGEVIRISIPPLTEERRKQLVKQSKGEAENAKVSVRNARREAIEGLKKEIKNGLSEDVEKDAENEVQKLHDKYMKKIDSIFADKEKEILMVQAKEDPKNANKPDEILEKIAEGKMRKFFEENTLLNQLVVGEKETIAELIRKADKEATVIAYKRFALEA